MASISAALRELGILEWTLTGNPSSEEEFNQQFKIKVGEDGNGAAILSSDTSDFGVTWAQITSKLSELDSTQSLTLLREERNRRLVETDVWGLQDYPTTAEQTAYRQALRDITQTYSSLDDVVWPVKPT